MFQFGGGLMCLWEWWLKVTHECVNIFWSLMPAEAWMLLRLIGAELFHVGLESDNLLLPWPPLIWRRVHAEGSVQVSDFREGACCCERCTFTWMLGKSRRGDGRMERSADGICSHRQSERRST